MGFHARPASSRIRRLGRISLAIAAVAALAAGISALGIDRVSEATPTTTVPPTIAPTASPAATATTAPLPVERPYGGDVKIGIPTEPITLNPFLESGGAEVVLLIGRTAWAGAIALDGLTHDPVPVLANDIPTFENGGLVENSDGTVTVTYRIHPDAKWEDGSPVTGADFEFTYRLATDPSLPVRADVRAPYTAIVPDSLQVEDSMIIFDLVAPSLAYLDLFSIVVPVAQVEESDFVSDWTDQFWMSAGPFRFAEWVPGDSITMERNDEYWGIDPDTGQQLPYLDQVVFDLAADPGGVVAGFQTGGIEVVALPSDPTVISEIEALDGVDVQVGWGPTWEHLSFQFGPGRFDRNPDSLNEYLEYRRAVAHGIDRGRIVEAVAGGLVPVLDSPLSVVWPAAASAGWSEYQGDPGAAAEALDALPADVDVSIPRAVLTTNNTPERAIAADELGSMFSAAGVALEIDPPEETGVYFLETIGPGSFDLAEWAWVPTAGPSGAVADIGRWFLLTPEAGGSNFSRWPGSAEEPADDMARLTGLLESVAAEPDLEEVKMLLSEIETFMADLVVSLPLYAELNAGAVRADAVSGYRHSIIPGGDTWNVATWYRTAG